ncbi:galactose mutarotase-like protein [Crassisporium funariophilum]|nr:galactose mutarotase-like protein [Crassisporium funariophilum]
MTFGHDTGPFITSCSDLAANTITCPLHLMPVENTERGVLLKHPKGPTVEILFYGATVISWKAVDQAGQLNERLFVSSKAALDGTKPVRGGIPVVFPCFGAPTHPDHVRLAQHGFARNEIWDLDSIVMDNEAGVSIRFTLDPNDHHQITSLYSKPFHLSYVITLAEHQLSTDLHVKNTSSDEILEFQALLHTYIRAPADEVLVMPLENLSYYDKTEISEQARATPKIENRSAIDVKRSTDSVYENAPLKYTVKWPNDGVEIKATHFKDVVIWNPQEEGRKIGDMEIDGWKKYICVEPGYVRGFVQLEPQKTWIGQQVISIIRN